MTLMFAFLTVLPAQAAEPTTTPEEAVAPAEAHAPKPEEPQPEEPEAVEPSFPSSPPISIDDAETVEKGHVEVNFTVGASGKSGSWETETPLIDGNLGLTDNIHINAEIPYVFGADDGGAVGHGLGRGAVALKVRVIHTDRVQLAFHPAVELPPIPTTASYEAHGAASLTLPVVLDFAVGDRGGGVGIQLSRSFTTDRADETWGGAIGFATPLGDTSDIMFDYAQEASTDLVLGEGWFDVGYTQGNLFGSEHLTLLSALGRSTRDNTSALLGVQVSL